MQPLTPHQEPSAQVLSPALPVCLDSALQGSNAMLFNMAAGFSKADAGLSSTVALCRHSLWQTTPSCDVTQWFYQDTKTHGWVFTLPSQFLAEQRHHPRAYKLRQWARRGTVLAQCGLILCMATRQPLDLVCAFVLLPLLMLSTLVMLLLAEPEIQ